MLTRTTSAGRMRLPEAGTQRGKERKAIMKVQLNDNLRRCPFCGGEAAVETMKDNVSVSCTACGIAVSGFTYNPDDKQTMYDAIHRAVKEWNQIKP